MSGGGGLMASGSCGGALPAGGGDAAERSGGGGLAEGGDRGRGGSATTGGGAPGIGEFGDEDEDDIVQINQFSPFQLHHLTHFPGDQIIENTVTSYPIKITSNYK